MPQRVSSPILITLAITRFAEMIVHPMIRELSHLGADGEQRMKNMEQQKRILVPTRSLNDWKGLLAEPEKHWKPGYSAMLTAQTWENASGLPLEIASVFEASENDHFKGLELALAIPEYKVILKGGARPSQNDVFALLTSAKGLTALTVEGKAREDFGPTLAQWQCKVSGKGYRPRLRHILENIGLKDPIPDHIRYQLLHRTASAVLEAKRFHCMVAVMIVQSFVKSDFENHFKDYVQFIQLYGKTPTKDNLILLARINEIMLYSAWVFTQPPADDVISPAS